MVDEVEHIVIDIIIYGYRFGLTTKFSDLYPPVCVFFFFKAISEGNSQSILSIPTCCNKITQ